MWRQLIAIAVVPVLFVAGGCDKPKPTYPATSVQNFQATGNLQWYEYQLHVKYTGASKLESVDCKIECVFENKTTATVDRYWSTWQPQETKTISIPLGYGQSKPQRVVLSGSAGIGSSWVTVYSNFLLGPPVMTGAPQ